MNKEYGYYDRFSSIWGREPLIKKVRKKLKLSFKF